jgi:hypothetical protein
MAWLPLRARDGAVVGWTLVDDADLEWLSQWTWRLADGYAKRGVLMAGRYRNIFLHQLLCQCPPGKSPDHINGDRLDNRRANLRPATVAENTRNQCIRRDNTSGFKGVSWDTRASRWKGQIHVGGRTRFLGYFATAEEAHERYQAAARELFGEFHRPPANRRSQWPLRQHRAAQSSVS